MAKLETLVEFLDGELKTSEIPDYPGAHNGLQLQSPGPIQNVASAVDASLPVIEKAVEQDADLLIVHHGLFWQGVRMMTGAQYQKFKLAMDHGLAIYSSHIPLDVHPKLGNNVLLSRALGFSDGTPFLDWKGVLLARRCDFDGTVGELADRAEELLGSPVNLRGDRDSPAGAVGIITGGAGSEVEAVAAAGIQTFVTGEGPHWSHPLAEELGLNVLYGGHYATETFGVRALGDLLADRFNLSHIILDHPTGL